MVVRVGLAGSKVEGPTPSQPRAAAAPPTHPSPSQPSWSADLAVTTHNTTLLLVCESRLKPSGQEQVLAGW